MGFPLPEVTYLAENLSGLKIFHSLSFIDPKLFCFPPLFSIFTSLRPSIENPSFSFLLFFSLFSSFLFLSFHLFLFFLFTSPSPSLCLGNRVLAFYSLSLEEIPLSSASGKEWGFFFIGQGSKRSKVVFQWGLLSWEPNLDIWGETNLGVKVLISGRTSILFHKARVTMMI
ncbi:hypothetical protein AAZX31_18G125000 [Glycine max]